MATYAGVIAVFAPLRQRAAIASARSVRLRSNFGDDPQLIVHCFEH